MGTLIDSGAPDTSGATYQGTSIGPDGFHLADLWGGAQSGSWLTTTLPNNTAFQSDAATATALGEIARQQAAYASYINVSSFTSTVNVVPFGTARVPVTGVGGRMNASFGLPLKATMAGGVPIPNGLLPTNDSDAEIVIYSPEFNEYWEMWVAKSPAASGLGVWTCEWGGRLYNARSRTVGHWWDNLTGTSTAAGGTYEDHNWGAQATSIPLSHTEITLRDLTRGVIDHPLHFMLAGAPQANQVGPVWPAQRYDGGSAIQIPQGTRLRLPSTWTPSGSPLKQMCEVCMRDYSVVFTDTAAGLTLRAEPGAASFSIWPSNYTTFVNSLPWSSLKALVVGSDSNQTPTV